MITDSIIALFIISIIIVIYSIYLINIRFNKKNTINKIVENHLRRIKSHFNDPDLKYINHDYELGYMSLINEEVKIKLMEFIINRGFKAKYVENRDGFTHIEIR